MITKESQEYIKYLRDFAADTTASLTLVGNYDLKKVARVIDHLLNHEFGTLTNLIDYKNELKCQNGHLYNYDLFDKGSEYYCIHCGRRADNK